MRIQRSSKNGSNFYRCRRDELQQWRRSSSKCNTEFGLLLCAIISETMLNFHCNRPGPKRRNNVVAVGRWVGVLVVMIDGRSRMTSAAAVPHRESSSRWWNKLAPPSLASIRPFQKLMPFFAHKNGVQQLALARFQFCIHARRRLDNAWLSSIWDGTSAP